MLTPIKSKLIKFLFGKKHVDCLKYFIEGRIEYVNSYVIKEKTADYYNLQKDCEQLKIIQNYLK